MGKPIAKMLPVVMYHVYKQIVIRRNIIEARTQGGGTNVAMEGPGAESGPWGGGGGAYLKPKLWG